MAIKVAIVLALLGCAAQVLCNSPPGFRISGTKILDKNGKEFVMRGINHPHSWFKDDMEAAITHIAKTGSNTIRIVLSNGDRWWKDDVASVEKILDLCEKLKMVVVLSGHDTMGEDDFWRLDSMADYFLELAPVLKGREDRVIINVGNEWTSSFKSDGWAEGYIKVLPKLRAAGLTHLFVVDTAGWGQYAAAIPERGMEVFEADPMRNLAFSIHMYENAAPDRETLVKNIDNALAIGVPLIIGEFSDRQNGKAIAYKDLMQYCKERNVGMLVWSWFGNSDYNANMDLATGPAGELTKLGKEIIDGENGIRETSKPASIW